MRANTSANNRPYVLAVGQIPPPVTGYAYITDRMIATLRVTADVETVDLSPGERQGFRKHYHKSRQTMRACWRVIRNQRSPRLAYLGCEGDWGLFYTGIIIAVARVLDYTVLLHHHSFSYIDRTSRLMQLILMIAGRHIHHIFLCTVMRDRFGARYGETGDSTIVSNAAFVETRPLSTEKVQTRRLRIGLLSNLTREKGLYTFIELIRAARASGLELGGILAGPIADDDDKSHVASAAIELSDYLRYVGPVYGSAKEQFYSDIDVFIFPTHYANEAQPTVLFEALAAGKHVIAYNRGCIGAQIGHYGGLAIETADDFCAQALIYLKQIAIEYAAGTSKPQTIVQEFSAGKAAALTAATKLISHAASPQFDGVRYC